MNKREQHLLKIEIESFKNGYVSQETIEAGRSVRHSLDAFEKARRTGLGKRDRVLTESGYYIACDVLDKAKYEIKRHLSCSGSFSNKEGKAMLANYEQAVIERNKCNEAFERTIKETEYSQ